MSSKVKKKYPRREIYREIYYMDLKISFRKLPYGLTDGPRALVDWCVYVGKTLRDLLTLGKRNVVGEADVDGKIWLVAGSVNNVESLRFLDESLASSCMIATNKKVQRKLGGARLSFHHACYFWWTIIPLFFQLWPEFGRALLLRPDGFWSGIGLYETSVRILQRHRPRALIFANDHSPHPRALLWAGKQLGIPTVYVQHASVRPDFPPLRYDLSLLEGRDSLEKYRQAGPIEGRVALIGMPKFDAYLKKRNLGTTICAIGLCANIWDEQRRLENVLQGLRESFPQMNLYFRPHPGDERVFHIPDGTILSNAREEPIFDFLSKLDLVIAGDTSLHLEACLLNVASLYFSFNELMSDAYGYVAKGLVEKKESLAELLTWIAEHRERRPVVWPRAQHYNATINTPNEGKSRELAIAEIRNLLDVVERASA